jgi:hypothetical protein
VWQQDLAEAGGTWPKRARAGKTGGVRSVYRFKDNGCLIRIPKVTRALLGAQPIAQAWLLIDEPAHVIFRIRMTICEAPMGHTIWVEAKGRSGSETHNDMSVLKRLDVELDVLAAELGVTKLTEFYDYSQLLEEYGDEAVDLPDPSWFDSAKGLETVKALREQLAKDFDALKWKPDDSTQHFPKSLLEDLEFCQAVLEEAVARWQPFRLLIVS